MTLQSVLKNKFVSKFVTDSEDGIKLNVKPEIMLKNAAMMIFSAILGSSGAMFSSYPFGIALLSASNEYLPACFFGLLFSSLFNRGYAVALAITYTAVLMLHIALSRLASGPMIRGSEVKIKKPWEMLKELIASFKIDKDSENMLIRCSIACFAAFVFGLYRLISGGFLYYDLFGLLFGFFVCPGVCFAFGMAFSKEERFAKYMPAGVMTMAAVFVFSLRDYSILGFSPSFAVAMFIALWAAMGGALKGCAVGLIAGIACGTSASPASPYIIAAAGLVSGAFNPISKATSAAAVCLSTLAFGLASDGFSAIQSLLPDTLCALTVFLPLAKFRLLPKIPVFSSAVKPEAENAVILERRQEEVAIRMNSLSEAFSRLSEVIYSLSDRLRRPGIIDLRQICDSTFDEYCRKCSLSSRCLDREYSSVMDAQSKIASAMYAKGRVESEDVPEYLSERCYSIRRITEEINNRTAMRVEELMNVDKTRAFAVDYEVMSKLLAESVKENDAEYKVDSQLTKRLNSALRAMSMRDARGLCFGSRRKQVVVGGAELSQMRLGAAEIKKYVENALETRLSEPKFAIDGGSVEISMSSARRFRVEHACSSGRKENESANGDTALMFETREDYFYSFISDGMGSGREAAITSRLCGVFVEQLLSGGNNKKNTLEMLHAFLKNRGEEISATIDLAEIDLLSGKVCFVKSGAAPSFVLRGKNLYRLRSKTVPLGIMKDLDAEQIKFDLCEGDVILMISDGVTQSLEDGVWLANLLTYEWVDDLQAMADKILDNAVYYNSRSDDITVSLMKICPADEVHAAEF